jgi:hypothetical protein
MEVCELRIFEGMERIQLGLGTVQWRAPVNAVMIIPVAQNK